MLNDESPMPFGKHKGVKMANVPADYLLWVYEQIKRYAPNKMTLAQKDIKTYVEDNLEVLKSELKK